VDIIFVAHILFVVNREVNAVPTERLQPVVVLVSVQAVADIGWFGGVEAMSICNEPNAS